MSTLYEPVINRRINRVDCIEGLLKVISRLQPVYSICVERWGIPVTIHEARLSLLNPEADVFADYLLNDELAYLFILRPMKDMENVGFWDLAWVSNEIHDNADEKIREFVAFSRAKYPRILATSNRISRSYERWISKFGFIPTNKIYTLT